MQRGQKEKEFIGRYFLKLQWGGEVHPDYGPVIFFAHLPKKCNMPEESKRGVADAWNGEGLLRCVVGVTDSLSLIKLKQAKLSTISGLLALASPSKDWDPPMRCAFDASRRAR